MNQTFLLAKNGDNKYPQIIPLVSNKPLEDEMKLPISTPEIFSVNETIALIEQKKKHPVIDYMIPPSNHYTVTRINKKSIELMKISKLEEFEDTAIQIIQKQLPGAEKYLHNYNRNLAMKVMKKSSNALLVTSIGGVIHTDYVEIISFDGNRVIIEIKSHKSSLKHLQYINAGKLIIENPDSSKEYYVQVNITNIETQSRKTILYLNINSFSYGKQTNLEKYEFSRSGISISKLIGSNLLYWFHLLRVPFFTLTLLPVLLTFSFIVYSNHSINYVLAILTILGLFLVQSGANLLNDFFDYRSQADKYTLFSSIFAGDIRFIRDGLLQQSYALLLGSVLLFFGGITGIYLNIVTPSNLILLLGIIGGFIAYFYSGEPIKFAYRGVGELLLGITFGPLVMIGVYYVQVPQNSQLGNILLLSIPIALFLTIILMLNSFQKAEIDELSEKNTTVVRLGKRFTSNLIIVILFFTQGLIGILYLFSSLPNFLLGLIITIPISILISRDLMRNYKEIFKINSIMLWFIFLYFITTTIMGILLLTS